MSAGLLRRWLLRRFAVPREAHAATPADYGLVAIEVGLPARDGRRLHGWFVPPAGGTPAPAVLVMHGWGANASLMLPLARPLHDAGHAVLLIDARGHGASENIDFMSLPRFAEDVAAGLDWLGGRHDVDRARLSLVGHSVGAAAVLLEASRRDHLNAVIALSAFAHPRDMMRRHLSAMGLPWYPLGALVTAWVQRLIGARFDDIAPLTTLPRARCPVLLAHGLHDNTVPFAEAERLAASRPGTALIRVDAGHDLSEAMPQARGAFERFLNASASVPET
ncbi:alpha/beta hydrolase [Methyloversatilis discipulorum]|uniref:alpha/beta hydrolase n=1 Tax=Methyloversatilis discipulorum TaxID=1119528 RepID=UPI001A3894FA|nr:alpha/beta fold hydrolase [Methyloversatilis discipulorum]MBL8470006.1 alpha/beta fold hydrolase [Methyloversatilis discipulorum]